MIYLSGTTCNGCEIMCSRLGKRDKVKEEWVVTACGELEREKGHLIPDSL